ncbi:MAG: hypothetical protein K2W95_15945 [Candidatus Obscuribacterales bacterium]|nr:hypothetical protein [Candidatus Obscuribacterales bacterium]
MKATYRLQISNSFTFGKAADVVRRLLKPLGISHAYVSPALESVAGSNHGYDVVNPHQISVERGGIEGYRELAGAGLAVIQDIVPNHEFLGPQNARWSNLEDRARLFDMLPDGTVRKFFYFDLCALRIDEPAVFDDTHRYIIELVKEGLIQGIRLDYINGLEDPAGYLATLHEATGLDTIWVERILGRHDVLPWKCKGTVGYEFLRSAHEVFMHPDGEDPLTALYTEVTGETRTFLEMVRAARLEVVRANYAHECGQLLRLQPDLTRDDIETALAAMEPRTFIVPGTEVTVEDRAAINSCAGLPDVVRRMVLLEEPANAQFVVLLQQVADFVGGTSYLKTYYRHHQLIARNEMGVDAGVWSIDVNAFHAFNTRQLATFPDNMNTLESHDTFLSRDARARIVALSHIPDTWREKVLEWYKHNSQHHTGSGPDSNTEYRLYQALLASWPISLERFLFYVRKSNREATMQTSWGNPNQAWEASVEDFVRKLYADVAFIASLEQFLTDRINPLGDFIATGQLLLQLTSPGVADIYYGDEMRRLSLIDPDQRRDIDWDTHVATFERLQATGVPNADEWRMFVIMQALALRGRHESDFSTAYTPVERGADVVCYQRGDNVMVEVPVRDGVVKQGPPAGWTDLLPSLPFGLYERV